MKHFKSNLFVLFRICLFLISTSLLAETNYQTYAFKNLYQDLGYENEDFAQKINLTDAETSALDTYSEKFDTYYRDINLYLRSFPNTNYEWDSISPTDAADIVKNLDSYFLKTPLLPNDLILFRGVNLNYKKNKAYEVGEEFTELGLVSTTTTYKVAYYFAAEMNANTKTPESKIGKAILVLYSEKNSSHGILIDQDEDEVLLPHGQKMKIMQRSMKDGIALYLTQVCASVCQGSIPSSALKLFNRL